jgi:hypothetical protein
MSHSAHDPPRHTFLFDGADAFADIFCQIADALELVCNPQYRRLHEFCLNRGFLQKAAAALLLQTIAVPADGDDVAGGPHPDAMRICAPITRNGLGAARALYKNNNFAPDVIAGVSRLADARDQAHRSLHRTRRVIRP